MHSGEFRLRFLLPALCGAFLVSCGSAQESAPTETRAALTPTARRVSTPSPTIPTQESSAGFPLALGGNHSCALTAGNGIVCWGNNRYGQLGNGTTLASSLPTPVSRMTNGVTAIAAGWAHTCALRIDGSLECWGVNTKGQLGDSTTADSWSPVTVTGLDAGVQAVTAGHRHTCALTAAGGVKCWGENTSGGVGDGTSVNRNEPVDVPGLAEGVKALEAGAGHTCALLETGAVICWGWNVNGQLGNGTNTDSRLPADVGPLPGPAVAVAAGDQHTCALIDDGSVVCWGANASGQLGNGTRQRKNTPAPVLGLASNAVELAAGGAHTCALLTDGRVQCWGDDQSGQLGDGGYENQSKPVDVTGLTGEVKHIAAGFSHTCAVLSDRRILCWGWNTEGQLGDGTAKSRRVPGAVAGFSGGAVAVSAGWSNTCALLLRGGVRCWGLNSGGQLGDGTNADSGTPMDVSGLDSGRVSVAVGGAHVCALSARGGVKCWGRNERGQLGSGGQGDQNAPVDVAGLPEEVVAVAAGKNHTCALTIRGGVKCWGANESGQLGNGKTADSGKPVDVVGLAEGVRSISAGADHTCALGKDGGLKCWGSNTYGQLGDGTLENHSEPVRVGGLDSDVNSVSAGGSHTCAIVSGAALKCWGWNAYGQLGDSTPTDRNLPADVKWLAGTAAFAAAGYDYTCAIMRAGNLRCWGNNEFGQLGDGTAAVHHTPIDVLGLEKRVIFLAGGPYHACAVVSDGALKCWGNNLYGQLGHGLTANSGIPADVLGLEE
jgi:alpha-tubulin suppressor-like RCC1 family protein